jgi:hypothetical protein
VLTASCAGESEDPNVESSSAALTTYEVGPGKPYASLKNVASLLKPGDVVNLYGGTTYAGDVNLTVAGTAASKITIHGVPVNGKRPVLSGGTNTLHVNGDHMIIEGLEITGGTSRCVFHHADDIVIRDTVVHDCPHHGILGADQDSGSLTLDRVEVYKCGSGDQYHQVYMATDETAHPHSVFRMQNSFIHDGNGGNNVKSRAERNEIYYNWIEGAFYHDLELIGPDGQADNLAREDSDVVGNVLYHAGSFYTIRIGGDGTGDTSGRYRFVNNTIVVPTATRAVFQMFDRIDSLEAHNNVIAAANLYNEADVKWVNGRTISGQKNWVSNSAQNVPSEWTGTLRGASPGLTNTAAFDFRPTSTSPLVNAGVTTTVSPSGHSFPNPLALPLFEPPARKLPASASARAANGVIDIGAYENGTAAPAPPPTTPTPPPTTPPPPTPPPSGACVGGLDATIGGTNLVKNSGFEQSTSGWDTYQASIAQVSGGHCGSYSAKLTSTASSYTIDDVGATLTNPAAAKYRASAWVRTDGSGVSASIVLREKTSSGSRPNTSSAAVKLTTSWQKISVERPTASGSSALEVYVAASGGGVFYVDDIALIKE